MIGYFYEISNRSLLGEKTMKKPSLREQMLDKKQKIQEREDNFRKKFEEAPKCVQDEYLRCNTLIKKFFDKRTLKQRLQPFEEVLYAPQSGSLTENQIVQLHDLLRLQGWEVVLSAALKWHGGGPRPIGLLFRNNPED
ncbi:MAG: hypothetical protein G01um101413_788 [Parcubacteria group bacterium Gr01-1014_13]|nr:MAG: hypothetical protein G01um101413_788 [Parcubacteria group bacterium Gr01-1014_13]